MKQSYYPITVDLLRNLVNLTFIAIANDCDADQLSSASIRKGEKLNNQQSIIVVIEFKHSNCYEFSGSLEFMKHILVSPYLYQNEYVDFNDDQSIVIVITITTIISVSLGNYFICYDTTQLSFIVNVLLLFNYY